MLQAGLGIAALFLADQGDRNAVEASKACLDGGVLAEIAVTGERRELGEQMRRVIDEMRALRMTCNLSLFPGSKLGIDLAGGFLDARLEPGDFVRRVDALVFGRELLQLVNLALEVRDGLFEIEISLHQIRFPVVFPWERRAPIFHLGLLIPVFGFFCKGVMCFHQLTKPFFQHMRIYLSGRNV
ncbi:hypothetical protein D3C71_1011790 [compost metagenome]